MKKASQSLVIISFTLCLIIIWGIVPPELRESPGSIPPGDPARGAYLVQAAGCISCHISETQSPSLSGGLTLASPFGNFHAPNITPDMQTGIGTWSEADVVKAIRYGRSPEGSMYLPAFPYRSYRGMTETDARDIAAWLLAQPPIVSETPDHELTIPLWLARIAMPGWNRLADLLAPESEVVTDLQIARGAYLARHLGHCGECHTPRNRIGMMDLRREFAGALLVEGEASAITPENLSGWTEDDFAFFLFLGLKPDDEYVGGEMEPVIEYNTSSLTEEDRRSLAAFFLRGQGTIRAD